MDSPAQPRSHMLRVANGRFHALEWGARNAASPLVLLHGFSQTCHSWDELAPLLGDSHRVIAFDQRGHGRSDRAADGDYSRQTMVEDVAQIADALGLERFALVGMSMGAVHAIALAAERPERVSALVIVDYAPAIETVGADRIKLMLFRIWDSFDDAVRDVRLFNPRRSEDNVRSRLRHSLAELPGGGWTWKVDPAFAGQPRFRESPEVMWDVVRRVKCRTLVVRGAESDILSPHTAHEMLAALADGQLVTVAGAGHSVPGDQPRALVDAVRAFLERAPASG